MRDGRVYCVDDVARPAGDDVLSAVSGDRRCRRHRRSSPPGTLLCRHRWTVTASLYRTRSGTSSQCKSACRICDSPRSYLRVPTDETCHSVQYTLQSVCHRPRCASEYHVAVVHPGSDEGVNKCLDGLVVQRVAQKRYRHSVDKTLL